MQQCNSKDSRSSIRKSPKVVVVMTVAVVVVVSVVV